MGTENLVPHSGKDNRGIIHWWLKDKNEIIDVTEDSYDDDNLPPYDVGKKSKWYGWGASRPQSHPKSLRLVSSLLMTHSPDGRD
jgi:hypothetical protein